MKNTHIKIEKKPTWIEKEDLFKSFFQLKTLQNIEINGNNNFLNPLKEIEYKREEEDNVLTVS